MTQPRNTRDNPPSNDPEPGTGHAAPAAATRAPAATDSPEASALVAQPSPDDIKATRTRFQQMTGLVLCAWQAFVTLLCNRAAKNIFLLAPCGAGKTLAFVSTLLFNPRDIIIIVSPLLTLGKQHVQNLLNMGISAVELTAKTISDDLIRRISACRYRAIVAPPEIVNSDRRVRQLLRVPKFSRNFKRLVLDEIHCLIEWSGFRPEYKNFDLFLSMMPLHARILCASATVTDAQRLSIMNTLGMTPTNTELIRLSMDCPNLFLMTLEMPSSASNYEPLRMLLPPDPQHLPPDCEPPPKFMVFMNSKIECVLACLDMMSQLPPEHRDKVCWFFSDMSDEFKAQKLDDLKAGRIWGIFCTDSAGLGIDVSDVLIVI
ncbi:P-loop containing nucleoside triphosphate hydrolase protein, partial [Auricularia subglabra TFB-10046 SS5]